MDLSDEKDAIVIEVYSQQFRWDARYAGEDNTLGLGNVNYIKGINTLGVDMKDKNSQDDKQVTELYLPKGRKIHFKFRSQDVLHSAYMPHFFCGVLWCKTKFSNHSGNTVHLCSKMRHVCRVQNILGTKLKMNFSSFW